MFFKCTVNKYCDNSTVFLSGNQIDFVQEVKYLGVLLNPSMKTSIDVSRQTRKFYAQANMLLRKCHGWGGRISRASYVGSRARGIIGELEASTTQTCSEGLHGNTPRLSKAQA